MPEPLKPQEPCSICHELRDPADLLRIYGSCGEKACISGGCYDRARKSHRALQESLAKWGWPGDAKWKATEKERLELQREFIHERLSESAERRWEAPRQADGPGDS